MGARKGARENGSEVPEMGDGREDVDTEAGASGAGAGGRTEVDTKDRGSTERRKGEHVEISLNQKVMASYCYWDDIHLVHHAIPEIDKSDIDLSITLFSKRLEAPLVISAMTGGYKEAERINDNLANVAAELGLAMGVGSQRAALEDRSLEYTYDVVSRYDVPLMFGNIGAPQIRGRDVDLITRAMKMVDADLMAVHLNYLQEVVQPEGETDASDLLEALKFVASRVPIIVKETGAGITRPVAKMVKEAGVKGIDVGGAGGTSFSAVEVYRARAREDPVRERLGNTFWDWGVPTPASVVDSQVGLPIIATGGIRNGLDVARSMVLGANAAGIARPLLKPATDGVDSLMREVETIISELRAAMFLVGAPDVNALGKARYVVTEPTAHWIRQLKGHHDELDILEKSGGGVKR